MNETDLEQKMSTVKPFFLILNLNVLEIFQFFLVPKFDNWISYEQALISSIGFFYSLGMRCVSHTYLTTGSH